MQASSVADWGEKRNLNLPAGRETLIYVLGRVARGEPIPAELWELLFRALRLGGPNSEENN